MAWNDDVVPMVRYIIGDVDTPQKYTDTRLKTAAVMAANFLVMEISFANAYVIDISGETVTPDPSTTDPKDTDFLSLLALRTSCLIIAGELKLYAAASFRVMDGPSSIDTGSIFANLQKLNDSLCTLYDKNKMAYQMGATGYGKAIMTPTTDENMSYYQGRF